MQPSNALTPIPSPRVIVVIPREDLPDVLAQLSDPNHTQSRLGRRVSSVFSLSLSPRNSSSGSIIGIDIPIRPAHGIHSLYKRSGKKVNPAKSDPIIVQLEEGKVTRETKPLLGSGRPSWLTRLCSCCWWLLTCCWSKRDYASRTIWIGKECSQKYVENTIKNQKYNIITFLPLVLFEQFKFFLNLFFLVMSTSQFIPDLRVGSLYTYWGPLGFIMMVTIFREAIEDIRRHRRDNEVNAQQYRRLCHLVGGFSKVPSFKLKVGDLVMVEKDQRVPADMVLLRTTEPTGSCFVRTDQLDGETDWKLRLAIPATHKKSSDEDLLWIEACVFAEKPQKDIHSFIGTYSSLDGEFPLSIENTLWANTVVASGRALGLVIYTGSETRSVMNNSQPRSKTGLLDIEINRLTKVLFCAVVGLSVMLVGLRGFTGPWYRYMFRFTLLFSYIIPISLRVNLDVGKAFYSWGIQGDKGMPGTVARSTTIPEELGRITYLLSDKTGTLTQNEMVFRKIHLGTVSYGADAFEDIASLLKASFAPAMTPSIISVNRAPTPGSGTSRMRRTIVTRVVEAVKAVALCHNVTPVYEDPHSSTSDISASDVVETRTYQASSPDEMALVRWTERVGLTLEHRDLHSLTLRTPSGGTLHYTVLQIFPFTSESKRMGIILREDGTGEYVFYMKGADTVMASIVQYNDWMEEECGNMAREGLRTLVVAKKTLTEEQYLDFETRYNAAQLSLADRASRVAAVIESLERDLELLCVTGVEDKLQDGVRPTLEMLANAGIKVWMLTGDKLETAICIANSSRLVPRSQSLHMFESVQSRTESHLELNAFRRKQDCALVIKGESLDVCLRYYEHEFMELACSCPAVILCRCNPTQKADVVRLIQRHTGKRVAAIGDGGNDVSMIQAADAGIGIVGKEGRQASLAADFSMTQFSYVGRLLLVHGRNSYKRSATLSQFVIHRGLIISIMQAVFSSVFYFSSVALYQGFLVVGYATVYTMFPVFSLVLDRDVSDDIALRFPELYKELMKGRSLSFKTFFLWILISVYQGGAIMYVALMLFEDEFIHIIAISFTALILTELATVALAVRTWHPLMVGAELLSLSCYILSLIIFKDSFDAEFIRSVDFVWKVVVVTLVSCCPLYILIFLQKKFLPSNYSKLM